MTVQMRCIQATLLLITRPRCLEPTHRPGVTSLANDDHTEVAKVRTTCRPLRGAKTVAGIVGLVGLLSCCGASSHVQQQRSSSNGPVTVPRGPNSGGVPDTASGASPPPTVGSTPATTTPTVFGNANGCHNGCPPLPIVHQRTEPLPPTAIVPIPWQQLEAPLQGITWNNVEPDPYSTLPFPTYMRGDSTVCKELPSGAPIANEGAPELGNDVLATGTLDDGQQYGLNAGGMPPGGRGLSAAQYALLTEKYDGGIAVTFGQNCPFPQFLPYREFITGGEIDYIDPSHRGSIHLVAPEEGHVIAYRYALPNGSLDPTMHHVDLFTDQWS